MAGAPAVDTTRHLIGSFPVLFWAFGTWLFSPADSGRGMAAHRPQGAAQV